MGWFFFQTNEEQHYLSPTQQPHFLHPPPPPFQSARSFDMENRISPSILLIIIILAIIFFISGLLHLLIRFLFRPIRRDPEDLDNVTAFQGQLQQLFDLHDAGVDQSYIDTLPVFVYKAIIGLKNPFDCAVCLCEFEANDKLRLLPKCSHAFHLECIDTWLLSHSTCPLCRGSLLPEFPTSSSCSPVVLVLESGSESSREIVSDRDASISVHGNNTVAGTGNQIGFHGEEQLGSPCHDVSMKFSEIPRKGDAVPAKVSSILEEKVFHVKLGKFRNVDAAEGGEEGSSSNSNVDSRRCFSMGSFEYVMDESSSLQVSIRPPIRKQSSKKPSLPLMPGHRAAMSECDCHSNRERFKEFDTSRIIDIQGREGSISTGNAVGMNKKESFSVSKIWLRSKEKNPSSSTEDSSRRAISFRFPLHRMETHDELKLKHSNSSSRRTISEMDVSRWESCVSELGVDEEVGSSNIMDSQANMPSFARRTLLWLVGRQNKVVHSSPSPNV